MRSTVTTARLLGKVPSSSNPLKSYEIRLGGDGVVYCSCQAWKINKYCKHLEQWHSAAVKNQPAHVNPQNMEELIIAQVLADQAAPNKSLVSSHKWGTDDICIVCGCSARAVQALNLKCNTSSKEGYYEDFIKEGIIKGNWSFVPQGMATSDGSAGDKQNSD